MTDRVQTKLNEAMTYAGYLRDELQQAHANGSALESLLILPMIQRATELRNDIEALMNAREAVKVPDDLPDQETDCFTCKHERLASLQEPCNTCNRNTSESEQNNWEPKP